LSPGPFVRFSCPWCGSPSRPGRSHPGRQPGLGAAWTIRFRRGRQIMVVDDTWGLRCQARRHAAALNLAGARRVAVVYLPSLPGPDHGRGRPRVRQKTSRVLFPARAASSSWRPMTVAEQNGDAMSVRLADLNNKPGPTSRSVPAERRRSACEYYALPPSRQPQRCRAAAGDEPLPRSPSPTAGLVHLWPFSRTPRRVVVGYYLYDGGQPRPLPRCVRGASSPSLRGPRHHRDNCLIDGNAS